MVSVNIKDYSKLFLFVIILILIYLAYKIISPVLTALLGAIILTIVLHPVYKKINKKIKFKGLSSLIVIILIIVLVIIPLSFFANALFREAINIFNAANALDLSELPENLKQITGLDINFERYIKDNLQNLSKFFLFSSSDIIEFLVNSVISLVVMFFLVYFLLIKGDEIIIKVKNLFPMKKEDKDKLFNEVDISIKGIFKGLFLIAVIEGIAAWVGFYFFGIPNPLIWSLVIAIFAIIPILGPILIWPPAVLYLILNGQLNNGIGLAIYSGIILTYLDVFLKPVLLGRKSKIDPAITLIGVAGGVKLMGLIGVIIGPLILSILLAIYRIYEEKSIQQV